MYPIELKSLKVQEFEYFKLDTMPETPGIYAIVDDALGIEYIGMCYSLKNRFTNPDTKTFDHHFYWMRKPPTPLGLSDCFACETYIAFWEIGKLYREVEILE